MITTTGIAVYVLLSALIGWWSGSKDLSFWRGFLFSLLFTPVGGSIMVGRARATTGKKRVVQTPEGPKTYCPYCASLVLVRAESCWRCGKNFRQQAMKDFLTYGWISLSAVGCIVIAFAYFGKNAMLRQRFHMKPKMDVVVAAAAQKPDLELISYDLAEDNTVLQGIVKNNTPNQYTHVSVMFVLFDNKKNPLDTISIESDGLDSAATWKFRYGDLDEKTDRATLLRVEGW